MAGWQSVVAVVVGVAAALTAVGVIWTKFLRPGARLVTTAERMVPVLTSFTKAFEETPDAANVLHSIVVEFRNNGGSTLRDVVDELTKSVAEGQRQVAELSKKIDDLTAAACEVMGCLEPPEDP